MDETQNHSVARIKTGFVFVKTLATPSLYAKFLDLELRFISARKPNASTAPTPRTTRLVIVSNPGDENGSALSACHVTIPTNPK